MEFSRRLNSLLRAGGLLTGIFACGSAFLSAGAKAEPSAFTVANYPVQAEAKDAVTAKRIAIEDGQAAALRSLLKRIVPVTAYQALDRIKAEQASRLVSGMSVRSEQNSSTGYYASLDFTFSPNAVRELLRREGVPFVDTQAAPVTLVPVTIAGGVPGKGLGEWGKIWSGLDIVNTVAPLRVAEWKAGLPSDALQQIKTASGAAMGRLAAEYGGDRVVVAEAEIDKAAGRLNLSISGQDAAGPIIWTHSYRITDGDVAYAMEYAAVVTLGVLEGRWKAIKARDMGGVDVMTAGAEPVRIQVLFGGAAEWYRLQQMVSKQPGVEGFQVEAVSARRAEVALHFPGGGQQLANVLARDGISLTNDGGQWVLRQAY